MSELTVRGEVQRIVFTRVESGYTVIHLAVEGEPWPRTVVGVMPPLVEGDQVEVTGVEERDHRFGAQIRATVVQPALPSSIEGVERYLASGKVGGVGPVIARRLVEHFGETLVEILDHHPERLREVPGVGRKKAKAIGAAWLERVASRRVLVSLYGLGLGNALSARLANVYGGEAFAVASRTPYRLAREVRGVGFLTADRLAQSVGIARNAPERIEAGISYYLELQSSEGHCYLPAEGLAAGAAELLQVELLEVEQAVAAMVRDGALRLEERWGGRDLYLPRLYNAEVDCVQGLELLFSSFEPLPESRLRRALEAGLAALDVELTLEQSDAVWECLRRPCSVITGGPGTGKTTVIKAVLAALRFLSQEVQLCAPTGRAAKRMTETTGVPARTIHRLLEYNPSNGGFQRDASQPVAATALVVDEVSMIDVELLAALLRALESGTRLVLVGDKDQLESVGPGAVLRDLIESGRLHCSRFTQIHRQAESSLIVVNSHRILRGEGLVERSPRVTAPDFFVVDREDPEACLQAVTELVCERIPRRFRLDPVRDIQVITPMHRGTLGGVNLNTTLQRLLNPNGQEIRRGERVLRRGDRVMQVKNNYSKEVFNGDVGLVEEATAGSLAVRMGDVRVDYDDSELDELVLAYAVTVHKAQGSEYPAVVVVLHPQHYMMLRRNLLYTAITRGKKLVVLVGAGRAIRQAIGNDRTLHRYTRLAQRLGAAGEAV